MTRSDGSDDEIWSTREELLLACAVSRHGTRRWDSVAVEVRSRSPFSHLPTAQTCKRRYHGLQRRFAADLPGTIDAAEPAPMSVLEGLRRLRVAELRREVERYDASIVSLQLKVERLKEDRERSLRSEQSGDKSDLPEVVGAKEEAASPPSSPGNLAVGGANAGDSRRSCNESNTTEPKQGNNSCAAEGTARNGITRADPGTGYDEKVACEGSYNGSSETVAKGSSAEAATPAEEQATANPTRPPPDAGESGESVTESKGEASKESSDFQSSASLPRRPRGRRKAPSGVSSGGEEAEADAISPSSTREPAKSQPLATFLQKIRSHKQAASFQRRLESQESAPYRSLIRQHMDLCTVQSKMEEGAYVADVVEFYRDLLLICTNAVVFFPGNSAEHAAGARLRKLVRKHILSVARKPAPTPPAAAEEAAVVSSPVAPRAKVEQDLQGSLLDKSISTAPLVACRKRSFIAGKTKVKVPAAAKVEEKLDAEKKEVANTEKKRTRERSATVGTRGLRTSKTRSNSSVTAGGAGKNTMPATASADNVVALSTKMDRKSAANGTAASANSGPKKRCAVNFLSRITRGGLSANGTLPDTPKSAGDRVKGGGEPKRGGKAKGRREQGTKQASGAGGSIRHARDQSLPVKRGVGRPPKRPLPPLPTPPPKRARRVEAELSAPARASASSKKRGRR